MVISWSMCPVQTNNAADYFVKGLIQYPAARPFIVPIVISFHRQDTGLHIHFRCHTTQNLMLWQKGLEIQ